jgi:hypothetical protein
MEFDNLSAPPVVKQSAKPIASPPKSIHMDIFQLRIEKWQAARELNPESQPFLWEPPPL